jgi:hypothetical protein
VAGGSLHDEVGGLFVSQATGVDDQVVGMRVFDIGSEIAADVSFASTVHFLDILSGFAFREAKILRDMSDAGIERGD